MSFTGTAVLLTLTATASALQPAFLLKEEIQTGKAGSSKCPCVGIGNLKGDFNVPFKVYNASVKYPVDVGSSCEAWERTTAPACQKQDKPDWCEQKWCYVDPCNCDLDILPKQTSMGLTYQGSTAYWSYKTCGGKDSWSAGLKDACVNQKNESDCQSLSKCAWDGKQCGGKEVVQTCKAAKKLDTSIHGDDDCRCIGIGGHGANHTTPLYINHDNDTQQVSYAADLGSVCSAWEAGTHPDCMMNSAQYGSHRPEWCEAKWCFVDPCKCKHKSSMILTSAKNDLKFGGGVAHFSYETCGFGPFFQANPCSMQNSSSACSKLDACAWSGTECLTKEVAKICGVRPQAKPAKAQAHRMGAASVLLMVLMCLSLA